jgi:ABC-2 type transport system permease protein
MTDALRFEWVRLRTLRSTWWLTILTIGFSAVLSLHALAIKDVTVFDYADLLTGNQGIFDFMLAVLLGMIGIFAIGHEYRYGTIRPTLSAIPRRSVLMAAKVVVVAGYVAAVAIVAHVVRYLVALAILGRPFADLGLFPETMGRIWFGVCIYMVVYALVGLALSALFRNIPAALVTLIVFPLVGENIIRALLTLKAFSSIKGVAKILPFSAGDQIFSFQSFDSRGGGGFGEVPSPYVGLAIFIAFLGIVMGLAWLLFEKRDA